MTAPFTGRLRTFARRPETTPTNPWVGLAVIMIGTVMVILDTTIVNVALHVIGDELHAGDGIEWVVTAYLLGICTAQPAAGWLADRFGRKEIFLASVSAFTLASVLCAMAPSLSVLIAFRYIQGLGGGAVMPIGMAMVMELFPPERHGRAIAVWGMAAMVAPAVGPTLGGWLVTVVSWHWLFLVNLPLGLLAVGLGWRLLPEIGYRERRPFDLGGLLSGAGGLSLFVLGVSQGSSWGWSSPATLLAIGTGVLLLVVFVQHSRRTDHPLLAVDMFANRTFAVAIGVALLVVSAQFGRLVFIPLELEQLRDFSALRVGLLLSPAGRATAVAMNIGGRLSDSIGPRVPVMVGCSFMAVAVFMLGHLSLTTSMAAIIGFLALQGFGMGLTAAPSAVAAISSLPRSQVAQGTTMRALAFQVGGALGVAFLGALLSIRLADDATPVQAQGAYNGLFVVLAGLLVAAAALASLLPGRPADADELELAVETIADAA